MPDPSTSAGLRRNSRQMGLIALVALAVSAISPLALEGQSDGAAVARHAAGAIAIPAVAPAGYLIEGRYADPPIIRHVPKPLPGDLMLTRAMPSS
jgi:hypothetical protein